MVGNMSGNNDKSVVPTSGGTPSTQAGSFIIPLTPAAGVDLSHLPEAQRLTLMHDYSRGMLDVSRRAQELGVDAQALANTLGVLSASVDKATQNGTAATASFSNASSIGRVEVVMGNTDTARAGKLTRSQTGERDWTPFYVFGGLVALVLIAALIGGR